MSGAKAIAAPKGPHAVWEAAKQIDAELSGISWGGFSLFGDKKSIAEVRRLMWVESMVDSLRERLKEAEARAND